MAEPSFLGLLRQHINQETQKTIVAELAKELTHCQYYDNRKAFIGIIMKAKQVIFFLSLLLLGCGEKQDNGSMTQKVHEVATIIVEAGDVPVTFEYVAQFQSSHMVNIQARVSGFLYKRVYTEGEMVKEGQVLFLMDKKPFQTQVDAAKDDAFGGVAGGLRHRHHGRRRRSRDRQRGDADAQPERGGDGCGRHPDADAQRRRHRDLYRRLRHQRADLQLHGGGRPEHRRPGGDGGQSRTATVKDGAGNAANLTGAVTNPAGTLQIDTTTPTVSSVVASGTGITAGAGDLDDRQRGHADAST